MKDRENEQRAIETVRRQVRPVKGKVTKFTVNGEVEMRPKTIDGRPGVEFVLPEGTKIVNEREE